MKNVKTLSLSIILTACVINLTESNNSDVSILMNKEYDAKCPKAVLGIPISNNAGGLPITEFTFCGKYYFRHLKDSILMYLEEPQTYLRILDFDEKFGVLSHEGATYFFEFQNQNIIPDQWQQICFARCPNSMKIILNNELVFYETTKDILGTNVSNTTLWLGGEPYLKTMYRRFEVCSNGKIYKVFLVSLGYPIHHDILFLRVLSLMHTFGINLSKLKTSKK